MKEYIKPEIEFVSFETEAIAFNGQTGVVPNSTWNEDSVVD